MIAIRINAPDCMPFGLIKVDTEIGRYKVCGILAAQKLVATLDLIDALRGVYWLYTGLN